MNCLRCGGKSSPRPVPDELAHLTTLDAVCKWCLQALRNERQRHIRQQKSSV